MSALSVEVTPEQQRQLERFYFHEARLLDNRQYLQWLTLLSEDVRYIIPSEHELEGEDSMGCPHREEGYILLMLRAERAYKINSWSENPPARTRRIVGNIELMEHSSDTLSVLSNFHLYYARPGSDTIVYSGQRRDTLLSQTDGFRIVRREVVLDYAAIELPTLGLFF
jgi:3-phenylpropionate/cinnamic acid dioxygenase small subunit